MKGLSYLVKEGLKNVWNNRIMSIASVCVLISCLVLTGAAALFSMNVSETVDAVGQNNETTVYLKDGYSQLEEVYIGKELEKIDNIISVEFYSKDEAFQQYKDTLGEDLFNQIEEKGNPLPDSYVVAMEDLSKYKETIDQIQKLDGVDSIMNRQSFADKLTSVSHLINVVSVGVVSALVVISMFIIANTIRATMYSRRFEISIMKSVGATDSFVRMPFLVEGMAIGLAAAFVSVLALGLLYAGIINVLDNTGLPLTFIPFINVLLPITLSFIVVGMAVGFFGSFISIRKYLKMEGNEILGW